MRSIAEPVLMGNIFIKRAVLREVLTFGRYLRAKFKTNVSKLPVSIVGFTCPNIDGKVARGGCIYCRNESFSPNLKGSQQNFKLSDKTPKNPLLSLQVNELREQICNYSLYLKKSKNVKKFIVYFQSFSNTYAPLDTLERLFSEALSQKGVVGISVGTRSDCMDEKRAILLSELSKKYEVWVEYGVQSIYDQTLKTINRGEGLEDIDKAMKLSKRHNLKVCAHLIFGLPEESEEMMIESVKKCIEWGVDSIKFHPLYVVQNTALAAKLKKGEFIPITEESYIKTVVRAISILPPNISVQRVSAGVDDNSLLAPLWCRNKNYLVNQIRKELLKIGLIY